MPILVKCPQCRAEFRVKEEFAGRQGPCPKCKAKITIPKPTETVVVHEPDAPLPGEKAPPGQAAAPSRRIVPVARQEVRLTWQQGALLILGVVAAFALAYFFRERVQESWLWRALGMLILGYPLGIGGYAILRNDELEPYRGRELAWRNAVCLVFYAALWLVLPWFPDDIVASGLSWIIIGVVAFALAAALPMLLLEIDYGSGIFHYALFLGTVIALGYTAGVVMPWSQAVF